MTTERDEVYMYYEGTGETIRDVAASLDTEELNEQAKEILLELGDELVDLVQAETPIASGQLHDSTYREVSSPIQDADSTYIELYVGQSAQSLPLIGTPYPYWRAVTQGLQPLGKLPGAYPPYKNLLPWVDAVLFLSGRARIRAAYRIAKNIRDVGFPGRNYFSDVLRDNPDNLQNTASRLGATLTAVASEVQPFQGP